MAPRQISIAADLITDMRDGMKNEAAGGNNHGDIEPRLISNPNLQSDLVEFGNDVTKFPAIWWKLRGNGGERSHEEEQSKLQHHIRRDYDDVQFLQMSAETIQERFDISPEIFSTMEKEAKAVYNSYLQSSGEAEYHGKYRQAQTQLAKSNNIDTALFWSIFGPPGRPRYIIVEWFLYQLWYKEATQKMIKDRGNALEYEGEQSTERNGNSQHRRTGAVQLSAGSIDHILKTDKRIRRKKRERKFDANGRPSDPAAHQQPPLPTLQEPKNPFSTVPEVLSPLPNITNSPSKLLNIVYQCTDHSPQLAFRTQAELADHCMRDHQIPYRICDYAACQLLHHSSKWGKETVAFVVPKFAGSDLEFKDHLREYHKEDISKLEKFSEREKELLYECSIEAEWWRCPNCLSRVFITKDGYICQGCNQPCDSLRMRAREICFGNPSSPTTPASKISVNLDSAKGKTEANNPSSGSFTAAKFPPTSVLSGFESEFWKTTGRAKIKSSSSSHFPGMQFPCDIGKCPAKGIVFDSENYVHHLRHVHSGLEFFNCDHPSCMAICIAFSQKYHLRNHLRDHHNEDINVPPSDAPEYEDWASQRSISSIWWRCRECLKRVSVAIDGWDCNDCKRPCEPERLILREGLIGVYQRPDNSRLDGENTPGPDMNKSSNDFPLTLVSSFHEDSKLKPSASPPTDADQQSDSGIATITSVTHTAQSRDKSISPEAKFRSHQIESIADQQKVIECVLEENYDIHSTSLDVFTGDKEHITPDPSVDSLGMFRCEYPDCWDVKDKFRFHVFSDLVSHYNEAHPSVIQVKAYPCDYHHTCGRSKDPFDRKDSYRDHLREFHNEDITRRHKNKQHQQEWLATRAFSLQWWRCTRCLSRIHIDKDGWLCKECKEPCEPERIAIRKLPPRSRGVLPKSESRTPPLSESTSPYPSGSESLSASELSTRQKTEVAVVEFIHMEYQTSRVIPFTTIKQLGHGSLGSVDAVRRQDDDEGTLYARKVIRLPNMARKRLLPLIQQEVKVLRELTHMHIVKVISTYETMAAPRQFGILLFPAGDEDLCHYLERIGEDEFPDEDIEKLKRWPYCLASAVSYIHSQNIRHKDIKPSNIICKGDQVFLTDFGSAHQFSAGLTSSTEGYALGITKMYSAPEVITEDRRGRPADIYSLGCVFAEMSTVANGRRIEDFHDFRTEPVPDEPQRMTLAYHATAHKLEKWFAMHDDWMPSLVARMMEANQKLRPTALEVLDIISGYFSPSCACAQMESHVTANVQIESEQSEVVPREDLAVLESHLTVDVQIESEQRGILQNQGVQHKTDNPSAKSTPQNVASQPVLPLIPIPSFEVCLAQLTTYSIYNIEATSPSQAKIREIKLLEVTAADFEKIITQEMDRIESPLNGDVLLKHIHKLLANIRHEDEDLDFEWSFERAGAEACTIVDGMETLSVTVFFRRCPRGGVNLAALYERIMREKGDENAQLQMV